MTDNKHYIFYRQDVLNLLANHKRFMALKCRELISQGKDPREATYAQTRQWTEQFFDEEVARGEVKLGDVLDDVEDIISKLGGKFPQDYVKGEK